MQVFPPAIFGTNKFTLIELLLTISIILLLASMAFPALQAAKEKAKEISCLNNERSIGVTVHLFASDHNSEIKPSFKHSAILDIDYVYEQYVDDPKVFACPTLDEETGMYLNFNGTVVICQYSIFSPFMFNEAYNLDTGGYSPSNIRLVAEALPPPVGYHWIDEQICPWNISAQWRHSKGRLMNIVYADGSGNAEPFIPSPIPSRPGFPPYLR